MNKKQYYILGIIFIISSGFLYSFERFITYYEWIGILNANIGIEYSSPHLPGIFNNIFIPIFIIIGFILIIRGYRNNN
ncbi:hypothetical protein [uncultured Clostridium sp.]|uniref:hypothetical protein n=1 Tax=uncultured Clostridium sp. TaxID=59620 RepID=UPI002622E2C6|nr:hypothetical protein [uncultured Clostridium sp.]